MRKQLGKTRKRAGLIIANGLAAYVAGVAYERGRAHSGKWGEVTRRGTASKLGAAFGNLFANGKPEDPDAEQKPAPAAPPRTSW